MGNRAEFTAACKRLGYVGEIEIHVRRMSEGVGPA
jgi:hypothetical protein